MRAQELASLVELKLREGEQAEYILNSDLADRSALIPALIAAASRSSSTSAALLPLVEGFSPAECVLAGDALIAALQRDDCEAVLLDLLPPLLDVAAKSGEEEYADRLIARLTTFNYSAHLIVAAIACLRDMPVLPDQLASAVESAFDTALGHLTDNDLPSFVYQLLLLSAKGSRTVITTRITRLFVKKEAENMSVIKKFTPVFGTVLLQGSLVFRQNEELCKEFVAQLKTPSRATLLSPFFLSQCFVVASVTQNCNAVFDGLKSHFTAIGKREYNRQHCFWVRELLEEDPLAEYLAAVERTLELSYCEIVEDSVLQFAFRLIDSLTATLGLSAVGEKLCHFTVRLVTSAFSRSSNSQLAVLDYLLTKLVNISLAGSTYIFAILEKLVIKCPHLLLQHSSKVKQLCGYLTQLSPSVSELIIKALMPLLKISPSLRDTVLQLLRKCLFSSRPESRLLAANGHLLFLQHFRVSASLPPTQQSQMFSASQLVSLPVVDEDGHESLCLELLNIVQRCLIQQAQIRRVLYKGLPLALRRNSQLAGPIVDLLLTHAGNYQGDNDTWRLDKRLVFSSSSTTTEPIPELVLCIYLCYQRMETQGNTKLLRRRCSTILTTFVEYMCCCDPEALGHDATSQRVVEAALEVAMDISVSVMKDVSKLPTLFKQLKMFEGRGKKDEAAKVKLDTTPLFTQQFLTSILTELFVGDKEDYTELRQDEQFLVYLLTGVQRLLKTATADDVDVLHPLARISYGIYSGTFNRVPDQDRSIARHALELFHRVLDVVTKESYYETEEQSPAARLERLLQALEPSLKLTEATPLYAEKLHRFLGTALSKIGSDGSGGVKEVTQLVDTLSRLARTAGGPTLTSGAGTFVTLCRERGVVSPPATRALLSAAFELSHLALGDKKATLLAAQDIHSIVGDREEDVTLDETSNYRIICLSSAVPAAMEAVLSAVDTELTAATFVTESLKMHQVAGLPSPAAAGGYEAPWRLVFSRVLAVQCTLGELLQTAIVPGNSLNTLLRAILSLYRTVSAIFGVHTLLLQQKKIAQLDSRLESLLQRLAEKLQPDVYGLIQYCQHMQGETLRAAGARRKCALAKQAKVRSAAEARLLPILIYAMEQLEKQVITYSKKNKSSLHNHFQRSTNRDFRIQVDKVAPRAEEAEKENSLAEQPVAKKARKS